MVFEPITVAERSKAWAVFSSSNTETAMCQAYPLSKCPTDCVRDQETQKRPRRKIGTAHHPQTSEKFTKPHGVTSPNVSGLFWFRIRSCGGPLWTPPWNFELRRQAEASRLAERQSASREYFCSMQLPDSYSHWRYKPQCELASVLESKICTACVSI
jgi:hypothetical protein